VSQSTQFIGPAYRNFIETVHSPFTRVVYKNSLRIYMQYRKIDDCNQLLEGDPKILQQQLIDYIIYLREECKLIATTINSRMAAIKKFYNTNDLELKWKKIKSYVGKGRNTRSKRDRPYTSFEITKMLEKADQRGRIAILLMSSSGIRVGAIPLLRIRNLERIEKFNIYKITVYENEDEEYITFCTTECTVAIDSYLEYRQRHGERPLKEDSPLIREEFDIHDEIRASRPRFLGVQLFQKMIKHIGLRSGVMEKRPVLEMGRGQRRPVKETHGFRKYFQTTAINAGMSPLYAEFLMGHSSGCLAIESYVRPTDNDLLEGNDRMIGYSGVIDALTIDESQRLRRENQQLVIKTEKIDIALSRINQLEKQLGPDLI
jgi:integrase